MYCKLNGFQIALKNFKLKRIIAKIYKFSLAKKKLIVISYLLCKNDKSYSRKKTSCNVFYRHMLPCDSCDSTLFEKYIKKDLLSLCIG